MTAMAKPPSPHLKDDAIEDAIGRLHETLAILDLIEESDLLGELPRGKAPARRHQRAVSLLAVLRRELQDIVDHLAAAEAVATIFAKLRNVK